ncbi:hypothetical protein SKC37_10275 [Aquirufa sp. HETE-83D]|uniref:DUF4258 domain-containing protein n=1 Tax=Aquirufa esocilacus TaxID=3096513 RepID=A0ABW6DK20_9BACT
MKKTYNTSWNPFEIQYRVEDESSNQGLDFLFSHTHHSFTRSSQRGINSDKIIVALEFGEVFYSQGLQWCVLGEKNIPTYLKHKKNQLMNTVVIVSGDSNQVITCYRCTKPFKNIKTKSKILQKAS